MTSWLVLCTAGGFERDAARIIHRNHGAAYIPEVFIAGQRKRLLPGYVFARWLDHDPPWLKLQIHKTTRGMALIYGALIRAGSDELATVSQRDIDVMEAFANQTAKAERMTRHKVGDLMPVKIGMNGGEVQMRVAEIHDGLLRLETMMMGRIVEKYVKVPMPQAAE